MYSNYFANCASRMPPRVREQQQLQMDSSSSNGVTSDFEEAEEDYDWDNNREEEEDRSQYQVIWFLIQCCAKTTRRNFELATVFLQLNCGISNIGNSNEF